MSRKKPGVPQNPTNKGIMEKIRGLAVGKYFLAPKSSRGRFYSNFTQLGMKCETRIDEADPTKIRVYRTH